MKVQSIVKHGVGIVTTTTTSTNIPGYGTTTTTFYENSNFLQIPDSVVGVHTRYLNLIPVQYLVACLV